jgi:hypothetical protein
MAKRTTEYNRININLSTPETLDALDNYKNIRGISRSKAVSQILDACVHILKDITYHHVSANELENRLLSKVYRRDTLQKRSGIAAEKHCLHIWHDKLQSGKLFDFDSCNSLYDIKESKRHTRRDNGIGKVEHRHIESMCQKMIACSDANYAIFIYFERGVIEYKNIKVAAGNGIALLAKNYFYDEYKFDFEGAVLINVYDLIPLGVTGIEETNKKLGVFCWVPIITYESKTVIVPVYKVDPGTIPTQKKPQSITIIHCNVNSQIR